jgi:hypothetical protein
MMYPKLHNLALEWLLLLLTAGLWWEYTKMSNIPTKCHTIAFPNHNPSIHTDFIYYDIKKNYGKVVWASKIWKEGSFTPFGTMRALFQNGLSTENRKSWQGSNMAFNGLGQKTKVLVVAVLQPVTVGFTRYFLVMQWPVPLCSLCNDLRTK